MDKKKPILACRNISLSINHSVIVADINLSIYPGQITGLLGPNGAGKSSTFYMLAGITKPTSGTILYNNQVINSLDLAERANLGIGYLPQDHCLFPEMTVRQNILSALELNPRINKNERQNRLDTICDKFSLSGILDTAASRLSGGEARRTEFARMLSIEPSILLLDEPFAGIDPLAIIEIRKTIQQLATMNMSILITDHNARELLQLCDNTYVLHKGSMIAHGDSQDIIKDPAVNKYYLANQLHDLT